MLLIFNRQSIKFTLIYIQRYVKFCHVFFESTSVFFYSKTQNKQNIFTRCLMNFEDYPIPGPDYPMFPDDAWTGVDDSEAQAVSNINPDLPILQPKQPQQPVHNRLKINQVLPTVNKREIIQTIFLKTPQKLKKVPLQFRAYIPNVGKMNIVYNPKKFDTNQFCPFLPKNIPQSNMIFDPKNDSLFYDLCNNSSITINPHQLHFIPEAFWPDGEFEFGDIVSSFFLRKNNANCRFYHKLYNALQISKYKPDLTFAVGVQWITEDVIKVNSREFARLLAIKSVGGALFHRQGNFPSHGFVELTQEEVKQKLSEEDASNIDFVDIKAITHKTGGFTRSSTEADFHKCNWVKVTKNDPSSTSSPSNS